MYKKFLTVSLIIMLVFTLAACSQTTTTKDPATPDKTATPEPTPTVEPKFADGIYFAQEDVYTKGWKYLATIEVKDGKIVSADWNGVNINGGKDKDTVSAEGGYPIVEQGGAKAPWHEQAAKAEAYLVETQDPTKIAYKDDEGHTDDIAGVSIHVKEFFDLAKKALDNGPVAKGPYKDGFYYAQEKQFTKGFKYFAHIAVRNGTIVGVDFNGIAEAKDAPDKDSFSKSGEYGLVAKGGAQAEWHEQATKAEAYLLKTQDPKAITYKDAEGHTDDIAGVSIHVIEFFTLSEEALAGAK